MLILNYLLLATLFFVVRAHKIKSDSKFLPVEKDSLATHLWDIHVSFGQPKDSEITKTIKNTTQVEDQTHQTDQSEHADQQQQTEQIEQSEQADQTNQTNEIKDSPDQQMSNQETDKSEDIHANSGNTQNSTQLITKQQTLNWNNDTINKEVDKAKEELKTRLTDVNTYYGLIKDYTKVGPGFDHDKWETIQKLGSYCEPAGQVIEMYMMFMPDKPSAEEIAIQKAVVQLTQKMEELHQDSLKQFSVIARNQFFLHSSDKIEMLEQLLQTQNVFKGKFSKDAYEFVCGPKMRNCAAAYRDWLATLDKNFQQLKIDGQENAFEGLTNLGYNREKMGSQVMFVQRNLGLFSQALQAAIAGQGAYESKQRNPNNRSPATLTTSYMINSIQELQIQASKIIVDLWPLLMTYIIEEVRMGQSLHENGQNGIADRRHRDGHLLKGYYLNHETFVHNMNKFLWATNPFMKNSYPSDDIVVDCYLNFKDESCYCPPNSWLRGQVFHHQNEKYKDRFIGLFKQIKCQRIDNYFTQNCNEQFSQGKDKWTTCDQMKFVTGIKRGDHRGIDGSYIRCCEINYVAPVKGFDSILTRYGTDDGRYSFKNEHGHWISQVPGDSPHVRSSNYGNAEKWVLKNDGPDKTIFKIEEPYPWWTTFLGCTQGTNNNDQFIDKDNKGGKTTDIKIYEFNGGIVFYQPWSNKFFIPNGKLECQQEEIWRATVFYGMGFEMGIRYELRSKPELFRTELNQDGWGFNPSFDSPWFAFLDLSGERWLKADKVDPKLMTLPNARPCFWEKWQLSKFDQDGKVLFAFKSYHNTYISCHPNGEATTNIGWADKNEKFIIYQKATGQIVLYNYRYKKYIRVEDGGIVKCNAEKPDEATIWYSGATI